MDPWTAVGLVRGTLRRRVGRGGSESVTPGLTRSLPARGVSTASRVTADPDSVVENPILTGDDVDDIERVAFVADPFVVRTDGRYHLFFEIKSARQGRLGPDWQFDIGHATSTGGRDWTYEGVVLPAAQAEHTYPYVFRHEDAWYMTPSPAGTTPREFRVYRADPFPKKWRLVDRSLRGRVRIDPTPFRFRGTWYVPYQETGSFDVRLAIADSLVNGDWTHHPADPLFVPGGNDVAAGGRPVVSDESVDLFFRRGAPGVVEHWRLSTLTPTELIGYELPGSPIVEGVGGDGWNGRNMHHVDTGTDDDLIIVDGQDTERLYRIGVYRDEGDGDCQPES